MPSWIIIVWWSAAVACVIGRKKQRSRFGKNPNELRCTDSKGEFLLGNRQYRYPLQFRERQFPN